VNKSVRDVALDLYLEAFDRFLASPTREHAEELDVARARWALEIALDEAQTRLPA
jgi:hypothetical protein